MATNRLPKAVAEFNAVIANPALTPAERIAAALAFDASGRPGIKSVQARQAVIRARRDHGAPGLKPAQHYGRSVSKKVASAANPRNVWLTYTSQGAIVREIDFCDGARVRDIRHAIDARRVKATGDGALAILAGKAWHNRVEDLYQSARADVVYGHGGQEGYDASAYSKAYRSQFGGARYKNAGALVKYTVVHPQGEIVIQNYRGTTKGIIPRALIPRAVQWQKTLNGSKLLLEGDLFAVKAHSGVWRRFAPEFAKDNVTVTGFRVTGVAVEMTGADLLPYYEHGADVAECRAENARKLNIAAVGANLNLTPKEARAIRLMRRICQGVHVHRESVRAFGACNAGIESWLTRHGHAADTQYLPLAQVRGESHPALQKAIASDLLNCYRSRHAGGMNV